MSSRNRALHLLALSAFAIAQPTLGLLASNGQFFVAHGAGARQIIGLLLALLLVPPLILWLLEELAGKLHPGAGDRVHSAFIGLLLWLLLLPLVLRLEILPEGVSVLLAVIAAGFGTWGYRRAPPLQGLLSLMAAASIVFGVLFLGAQDIRRLVWTSGEGGGAAAVVEARVPIVIVVFDELPLSSLLDERGQIDTRRYPAFAELASSSSWFPAASSVSDQTTEALPAIMTGRYPTVEPRLPIRSNHPNNLFSWLDGSYRLNVIEPRTLLYVAEEGRGETADEGEPPSFGLLLSDVGIVYLHIVLPELMREELPSVTRNWAGFGQAGEEVGEAASDPDELARSEEKLRQSRSHQLLMSGEERIFQRFIRRIEESAAAADSHAGLHFLHTDLPHGPWHLLPSGEGYAPVEDYGLRVLRWAKEPWWSLDAYRRHLMQLEAADGLLGELLESLRRVGLYDSSLLIITSDHGASFWPEHDMRSLVRHPHPEDLISIPLFIKRPGQAKAEVDRRAAVIIDIVPTIADVIGVELPWPMDGCSLIASTCEPRAMRKVFASRKPLNLPLEIPSEVLGRDTTLKRKLAAFGSGARADGLYNVAPHAELAGRSIAGLLVGDEPAGRVVLDRQVRKRMEAKGARVPARFVGELTLLREPTGRSPRVALVVGDTIATVVPAPRIGGEGRLVSAMLPPDTLVREASELRLYLVEGPHRDPRLQPLAFE